MFSLWCWNMLVQAFSLHCLDSGFGSGDDVFRGLFFIFNKILNTLTVCAKLLLSIGASTLKQIVMPWTQLLNFQYDWFESMIERHFQEFALIFHVRTTNDLNNILCRSKFISEFTPKLLYYFFLSIQGVIDVATLTLNCTTPVFTLETERQVLLSHWERSMASNIAHVVYSHLIQLCFSNIARDRGYVNMVMSSQMPVGFIIERRVKQKS